MAERLAKQLQLQRSIERSLENFKKLGKGNLTAAKIRARITSAKDAWQQFQEGHAALTIAIPEETRSSIDYFQTDVLESTEEQYQLTLDHMMECLEELEPPVSHSTQLDLSQCHGQSSLSLSHLPPIRLPPFDGSLSQWEQFRDRFKSLIIENRELNDFARMHFLTSCLTGRARETVGGISTTAENFDTAWQTLTDRYENKRRLLHVHLSSLFDLKPITRESANELAALRDRVKIAVNSLENLHRSPSELWSDALVHLVVHNLDPTTRKAWTVKVSDKEEPPSFEELNKFLTSRARALEELSPGSQDKANHKAPSATRICASNATASSQSPCSICQGNHLFSSCPSFTRATPAKRRDLVKQHRRCFNCLSQKHAVKDCYSKYSCRRCKQKHHSMLHSEAEQNAGNPTSDSFSSGVDEVAEASCSKGSTDRDLSSSIQSLTACANVNSISSVLLATAMVAVRSSSGRSITVRALLDQGSEVTFVAENVAQRLHSPRIKMPISVSAVGGCHVGSCRYAVSLAISSTRNQQPACNITAFILKSLTAYAPKRVVDLKAYDHLSGLRLADPDPNNHHPVGLILGADIYNDIILDGLRKGESRQPIAQHTIFGWVISGPVTAHSVAHESPANKLSNANPLLPLSVHHCISLPSLEHEIKKFWALEDIPRKHIVSEDDRTCEEHFLNTHSRASDGRYIVRLPFKGDTPRTLGHSRGRAEQCLSSLLKRLQTKPEQLSEYAEFLDEYERLGHMRKATASPDNRSTRLYIPHHAVFRESSSTSHIRVVFNASSPTSNGSSLNDLLLTGPKLQNEITSIILKWRQFKYVYTADIAKMYRQIKIDERDQNYQCILWRSTLKAPTSEYTLLTVTYGMTCAPFLALRVIKQLNIDEGTDFPLAQRVMRDHIYVDDCLFGNEDPALLLQTREELISLLRRGGFELRKWASNDPALLADVDSREHGLATKSLSSDEQLQILGLAWSPVRDAFQITVALGDKMPQTKRSILSAIAKLYDPLGWITPVTINAKIFMQQLWREKIGWDDPIPITILTRWNEIYTNFTFLTQIQIPRWTTVGSDIKTVELHGFADASNVAYAAVVYLKVESNSGRVAVTMLAGKSKVAPLTPLTIPRLELSAAVLLSRLLQHIRESLNFQHLSCTCWTDSTIVLAWLQQHPSKWRTFVANRVADVQERLPGVEWRHVSTDLNPADCASRGLLGGELLDHSLWWTGPPWLSHSRAEWPASDIGVAHDAPLEERERETHCAQSTTDCDLAARWSSWPKLLRVTAYIFRFIDNCMRQRLTSKTINIPRLPSRPLGLALTAAECSRTRIYWLRKIQSELFEKEISAVASHRALPKASSLSSLNPILGSDGILRVGGRLRHSPLPIATRHPIILAAHPLVNLLIQHAHLRSLHAGLQLTLNTLRQEYWILRARTLVKTAIYQCVVCTRERAVTPSQLMGDLPSVRVTKPTRSFLHCGVDYAGPFSVRASSGRGIKSRKAYIALFVCLATRAIHVELVSDYSTSAFLDAFTRFSSRRGLPESVYSDNGTTFVGADRELASAYRKTVRDPNFQNSIASDRVAWHFIPPSAPHFGGIWEAGVRSVKHHLRRVLRDYKFTFKELTTLLCKVEACLNSRPIAPLSDAYDDYEALTPGHFLIGSALTVAPEPSLLDLNENRLSRWQLVRQLSERFWKRWYTDYINTLQQRSKWRTSQPSLKSGQLVLMQNPNLPPCKWELGRVTKCHPGADGLTRVVTVKTATSEYRRPIVKLCTLPVSSSPET